MNAMTDANRGRRRLAPEMASFRLLVLAFVREYIGAMGESPSYGEIAAKLDSNRTRVKMAVRSLAADGLLIRTGGPRGLQLPSVRDTAIRQLRALGYAVDEDLKYVRHPGVTNRTLLPPAELRYPPRGSDEQRDGNGEQAA